MSFWIVNRNLEPPIWCSGNGSSTYYVGQLVSIIGASQAQILNGCCQPLAVPAGVNDTTNKQIPWGVVVGLNRYYDQSTTVGTGSFVYEAGVLTQANQLARTFAGAEGMYIKGDPQALIQVERIYPQTILRGNIYNAAVGTAPTLLTTTAASSTGFNSAGTTNACDYTPVADYSTIYCRTGANAGLYRVRHDTSTTGPVCPLNFPYAVAIGDTFVSVPLKQGYSTVYIGGPGLYIDDSNNGGTNCFGIHVTRLGLEIAGSEYAEFSFDLDHFCEQRA